MDIPAFLLRKLYKRGSLRESADGRFSFSLQNPLGTATVISPPKFTINGVRHDPETVHAKGMTIANISRDEPWKFSRGDTVDLSFSGQLLRGANRIHMIAETEEFGDIDLFVEDREANYCDVGFEEE